VGPAPATLGGKPKGPSQPVPRRGRERALALRLIAARWPAFSEPRPGCAETIDLPVLLLGRGYKVYRRGWVLPNFEQSLALAAAGGRHGTGKTDLLLGS